MSFRKYLDLSRKYLEEGERLLAEKDYVQASEKFWGAVVETIKAISEQRGWEHYRHHQLSIAISKLIEETKDVELGRLFSSAERLHANYYERFASPIEVEAYVYDVKELLRKLETLLACQT